MKRAAGRPVRHSCISSCPVATSLSTRVPVANRAKEERTSGPSSGLIQGLVVMNCSRRGRPSPLLLGVTQC
jgi:hypothetical protein